MEHQTAVPNEVVVLPILCPVCRREVDSVEPEILRACLESRTLEVKDGTVYDVVACLTCEEDFEWGAR